jgi:hypothetical protein
MIYSWLENLILLTTGLLGWPVAEAPIARQVVPVCAPRGETQLSAGPPGENGGVPGTAWLFLWRAVRR